MRTAALFVPVVVALVLGALLFSFALRETDGAGRSSTAETESSPTVVARPDGGGPRLPAEASVCQGVLDRPDPSAPRSFPAIYTRRTEAAGITIVAAEEVDPGALEAARLTVETVFARNDLESELAAAGAYVVVAAPGQGILDLPEFNCLDGSGNAFIYEHACGVADAADYPVVTVNQLDLLGDRDGPCGGVNILFHELGHLVHNWSISPPDYYESRFLYQSALSAGKYVNAYAATNPNEYFAEGTQAYFDHIEPGGGRHRAWLADYDPDLFAFLQSIYGE